MVVIVPFRLPKIPIGPSGLTTDWAEKHVWQSADGVSLCDHQPLRLPPFYHRPGCPSRLAALALWPAERQISDHSLPL